MPSIGYRGADQLSAEIKQTDVPGERGAPDEPVGRSRAISKPALGAVPVAKRGGIYTMTAQEGLDAAELVNVAFGKSSVGKATPRRLEVFAPDGPSTSGGKPVRQTIRLVPLAGETGPVMCGFLDVAQKVVELRSYDTLQQQYEARYGVPCDITAEEYTTLSRELQMTLTPFRYSFTQEAERHAAAAQLAVQKTLGQHGNTPDAAGNKRLNVLMLGVVVAVGLAVALTMLR
ncbi:MAG: hypothetical protein JWN04_1735 [Myxococcaceae bacterium]|nr:hypothetical protein [Myxococcaceae bacterium]